MKKWQKYLTTVALIAIGMISLTACGSNKESRSINEKPKKDEVVRFAETAKKGRQWIQVHSKDDNDSINKNWWITGIYNFENGKVTYLDAVNSTGNLYLELKDIRNLSSSQITKKINSNYRKYLQKNYDKSVAKIEAHTHENANWEISHNDFDATTFSIDINSLKNLNLTIDDELNLTKSEKQEALASALPTVIPNYKKVLKIAKKINPKKDLNPTPVKYNIKATTDDSGNKIESEKVEFYPNVHTAGENHRYLDMKNNQPYPAKYIKSLLGYKSYADMHKGKVLESPIEIDLKYPIFQEIYDRSYVGYYDNSDDSSGAILTETGKNGSVKMDSVKTSGIKLD